MFIFVWKTSLPPGSGPGVGCSRQHCPGTPWSTHCDGQASGPVFDLVSCPCNLPTLGYVRLAGPRVPPLLLVRTAPCFPLTALCPRRWSSHWHLHIGADVGNGPSQRRACWAVILGGLSWKRNVILEFEYRLLTNSCKDRYIVEIM